MLLRDLTINKQVENPHAHTDGKIEDFCDATLFKQCPLFSKNPLALEIIAYYDELELCNALGSHVKKQKVGIVSFTLGNIHPKYRSKLKVINLVLIAPVPIIEKHGLNTILEPFVTDINILATEGIDITFGGNKKTYKGALLTFLADNLASSDLGGFKKSFSFAFRFCRACMVTHQTRSSSYTSENFQARTEHTHKEHLKCLEGPAHVHYSKTYGINNKSCLLNIKYYSMFKGGLPFDCMHDILE